MNHCALCDRPTTNWDLCNGCSEYVNRDEAGKSQPVQLFTRNPRLLEKYPDATLIVVNEPRAAYGSE